MSWVCILCVRMGVCACFGVRVCVCMRECCMCVHMRTHLYACARACVQAYRVDEQGMCKDGAHNSRVHWSEVCHLEI